MQRGTGDVCAVARGARLRTRMEMGAVLRFDVQERGAQRSPKLYLSRVVLAIKTARSLEKAAGVPYTGEAGVPVADEDTVA